MSNKEYNIMEAIRIFEYADYMTQDEMKFLGNPHIMEDMIPDEYMDLGIPPSLEWNFINIVGMFQTISELRLWNRLSEPRIEYEIKSDKINAVGHSGYSFYTTFYTCKNIAKIGWKKWSKEYYKTMIKLV